MADITQKGVALAQKLVRAYLSNPEAAKPQWVYDNLAGPCSLLCRHAVTYHHIQERWCNEEMTDRTTAFVARKEFQIEERVRAITEDLPETDAGPIRVAFYGDPRGSTIKLQMPDKYTYLHDDWARAGVCVG